MSNLTVGSGKQFTTVSDAVAASHDGDTILVDAGTYTNDFASINTDITLTAVGGMVNMVATVPPPNGKAIFVTDGNITINGFSFSGARVPDQNGAGIRYQTGNLVINDCYFHHNENGLLGANPGVGSITIDDSEFAHNGNGSGQTHNLYVGNIGTLTITDSYFHDAVVGHEIKSRAHNTTITNSRIQDEGGTASYSIDLPHGGNALIQGNVIEQGPQSENSIIIAAGTEGTDYANTSLTITGNTIVNHKASSSALAVWNGTTATAQITGNSSYGLTASQIVYGPNVQTDNVLLTTAPVLNESHPFETSPPPPPEEPPPPPEEPPPPPEEPPPPVDIALTGGNGTDVLIGADGNDTLNGLASRDWLVGVLGNDLLNGGPGNDYIISGPGLDSILFDNQPSEGDVDLLFDFSSIDDKILLSSSAFTAAGPLGSLAPEAFFTGNAAHDADDRITYDSATGALKYDPDGTGAATSTQFATTLRPGLPLTNANFQIV